MYDVKFYYAGIGSRTISSEERNLILKISSFLSKNDGMLYSGNASGSDIAFQEGSNGKNIVFLPKANWNLREFDFTKKSKDYVIAGDSEEGLESISKYHPNPSALNEFGKQCMTRNYHQILGYSALYPQVNFVICCADTIDENTVKSGTNQAFRIAKSLNIPIFNLRSGDWYPKFVPYFKSLLQSKNQRYNY